MDDILSPEEKAVIHQAANSESYASAPVPNEIVEGFSSNITDFTSIPYSSQSKLASLFGPGSDYKKLLQADWEEALTCRALRMHNEKTVSFPTHIQLADRRAVEVSIARNAHPDGLPWFLSYVPEVERMRLMRDVEKSETGVGFFTHVAKDPLPPILEDKLDEMKESEDYQVNPIPDDLKDEVLSIEAPLTSFVWIPARKEEEILNYSKSDIDVAGLLNRDWDVAKKRGVLRSYGGKIQFPISVIRDDGNTLVEVAIKRDGRSNNGQSKPWFVSHVDNYPKQKTIAGKAFYEWAYLGNTEEVLERLADIALDEKWSFDEDDESDSYSILSNYLIYTFYKLKTEGKVLEDRDKGIAAFNTGLVDKTYEPIYACFSPSSINEPWRFEAFCKAGSRQWGKKLVSSFNPLPKRASYFQRKEDLLFDSERSLERDVDHILLDNIRRLPREFLEEELRSSGRALELLEKAYSEIDTGERAAAFSELRNIIEEDYKIRRRLIHRLDDAIELAQKRVEWNFKTAVPAYYPTKDTMSLLLPLDLTEDESPDVALVVELTDSGAYIGQTILTMRMAYNNARLICRPDSDWLNTSLKLLDSEEATID